MKTLFSRSAALSLAVGILIFSSANATAAGSCRAVFGKSQVLLAHEINEESLKDIVGARISYSGKYTFRDATDDRKISGSGIVQSAELWLRDAHPTFSIKYINNKGQLFHMQGEFIDPTFSLKIQKPSPLKAFSEKAQSSGLRVKQIRVVSSDLNLSQFLRQPENQKLTLLAIFPTGKKRQTFEVREVKSEATVVPPELDVLLSFGEPVVYKFQTKDGVIELNGKDIIALAY